MVSLEFQILNKVNLTGYPERMIDSRRGTIGQL